MSYANKHGLERRIWEILQGHLIGSYIPPVQNCAICNRCLLLCTFSHQLDLYQLKRGNLPHIKLWWLFVRESL